MATTFDEVPPSAFHAVKIIDTSDRPEPAQLDAIDSIVASLFGFALRYGVGQSPHLNQYEYGYLLPKGAGVTSSHLQTLESRLVSEGGLDDPFVQLSPMLPSQEKLSQMAVIGTLPEDALSGLAGFADDVADAVDRREENAE